MKSISLIFVLALGGCTHGFYPGNYALGEELCKDNGGLKSITVGPIYFDIHCNNDAVFIDKRKIEK